MQLSKILPLIIMLLKKECELRILHISKIENVDIRTVQEIFNCKANKSMHHEGVDKLEILQFESVFDIDRKHKDYSGHLHTNLLDYVIKQVSKNGLLKTDEKSLERYYNFVYSHIDEYTICEMCGSNISHYENY